jgi:uncharacterized membrane protein
MEMELISKIEWSWSGVGVKVCGVGVGMELEILNFSETTAYTVMKVFHQ